MDKDTPQSYYQELSQFLTELEKVFIEPIESQFGSISTSDELHLRAYILMAHAAFEEYIENIAIATASHYGKIWGKIELKLNEVGEQYSKYLKQMLHSNETIIKNKVKKSHGIKIDDLLKSLGFVIKIKGDRKNALDNLVKWRGSFAHRSKSATRVPDPKDLRLIVKDVYKICEDITNEAQKLFDDHPLHSPPST